MARPRVCLQRIGYSVRALRVSLYNRVLSAGSFGKRLLRSKNFRTTDQIALSRGIQPHCRLMRSMPNRQHAFLANLSTTCNVKAGSLLTSL
mmetsp:Transcript_14728/g.23958  ORF Transcript_14728/g.23958 Transcript_14728/m.23958 type:complete len:91 (+) Transcript_14728:71-343(+)